MEEKLALEQMRSKLLDDMARFHKIADKHVPRAVLRAALQNQPLRGEVGRAWDSIDESPEDEQDVRDDDEGPGEAETDDETGSEEGDTTSPGQTADAAGEEDAEDYTLPGRVVPPEQLPIALPSTLGMSVCVTHNLLALVRAERRLRVGQMNDALHRVRLGVGYKSVLYRTSVRKASSHRQKLRSFDEVHLADAEVLSNARVYTEARTSLLRLYRADDAADAQALEGLAKYQVLEKADLKANTALVEQAVRGVSQKHLPWFWSIDVDGNSKGDGWTAESAYGFKSGEMTLRV